MKELINAVETVARDGALFDSPAMQQALRFLQALSPAGVPALTDQQAQILALVAVGQTNQEIAQRVRLDEDTVRNEINAIVQQLQHTWRSRRSANASLS